MSEESGKSTLIAVSAASIAFVGAFTALKLKRKTAKAGAKHFSEIESNLIDFAEPEEEDMPKSHMQSKHVTPDANKSHISDSSKHTDNRESLGTSIHILKEEIESLKAALELERQEKTSALRRLMQAENEKANLEKYFSTQDTSGHNETIQGKKELIQQVDSLKEELAVAKKELQMVRNEIKRLQDERVSREQTAKKLDRIQRDNQVAHINRQIDFEGTSTWGKWEAAVVISAISFILAL